MRQEIARLQGMADRAAPAALVEDERSMAMMILGLDPDEPLDRDALRRAFRASVKRNHPDAGGSPHTLRAIIRAHDLLMATSPMQR